LKIISVNTSKKKGISKQPVDSITLVENHGVENDAHAGPGDRQVSLLAFESYQRFLKHRDLCLKNGAFGENIVTEGIVLHTQPIGTRMEIGDTVLEVSKIGKECHAPCSIAGKVGKCIMPTEGIFAKVIQGGTIRKGQEIKLLS